MKNILLVSHFSGTPGSPTDKLYDYFRKKHRVCTIKHPLFLGSGLSSEIKINQKKVYFKVPPKLQYLLECIYVLFYGYRLLKPLKKIHLAICFDALCFLQIYFLKGLFKVDKVIFYNLDYSKRRFGNPWLNYIYHFVNRFAYRKCDKFFYLNHQFIKRIDPDNIYPLKCYFVPNTVSLKSINLKMKRYRNSLVYAGAVGFATVDFYPLLLALKKLDDEGYCPRLDIYGIQGNVSKLKSRILQLGLNGNIILNCPMENKMLVEEILPRYQIGIAPYALASSGTAPDHMFSGMNLTAKIVDYIAAGLPVITTKLNSYFNVICDKKFGILAETPDDWYRAIKLLLSNKVLLKQYRFNALRHSRYYDTNEVLDPIMKEIL